MKNNKKINYEKLLFITSIILLIVMLVLTVYNFIFFPTLLNMFAIVLFSICNIFKNDKKHELYVAIIFGFGLALIVFSTIYTIISLLV